MNEVRHECGPGCRVAPGVLLGLVYRDQAGPARLGADCVIRAGTIIYGDVVAGADLQTGHHVTIREHTSIGDHVVIGTNTVIDGHVAIGSFVKIESNCYIPTHVTIGTRVFFGPNVVLTNDRYPLKQRASYRPQGPVIEDEVTLGAGVVVVPGITIGRGSFVAAGAVVTRDVPPQSFVRGVPARCAPLPEHLRETNLALSWMKHLGAQP